MDRDNARVADLYPAFHPAVLSALQVVADAARKEGTPLSICGELAGDPGAAVLLLAMGYDVLSMNATNLNKVKKAVRSLRFDEAEAVLKEVMTMDSSAEIHAYLEQFLVDKGMHGFVHARLD